jgi:glycosyltransferase involved in cell wall biosynthesis
MKISIITAVYNRNNTIERALMSIKKQTYKNIELIIIDGGSKDGTINTIKNIIDENDIFISESDNGIYDALNKGISLSSGEVIAFLHSDDMYINDAVLLNVAKCFSDKSIDVVYGDISFFYPKNPLKVIRKYKSDCLSRKNLAWGKMPAHPAIFIKRQIYSEIGLFDSDFNIAADYEFLCRAVTHKSLKTHYLPKVLVKMQLGGKSTQGIKNTILLNKEVMMAIKKNGIYTNLFMIMSKYPSKILQFFRK